MYYSFNTGLSQETQVLWRSSTDFCWLSWRAEVAEQSLICCTVSVCILQSLQSTLPLSMPIVFRCYFIEARPVRNATSENKKSGKYYSGQCMALVFRSQRNHHQVIHTKPLKHANCTSFCTILQWDLYKYKDLTHKFLKCNANMKISKNSLKYNVIHKDGLNFVSLRGVAIK